MLASSHLAYGAFVLCLCMAWPLIGEFATYFSRRCFLGYRHVLLRFLTTANPQDEPPPGKDSVEGIAVQQRCEVQPGGRRGVVEFVGEVEGLQVR